MALILTFVISMAGKEDEVEGEEEGQRRGGRMRKGSTRVMAAADDNCRH